MTRDEQYRKHAAHAQRMADRASNPMDRSSWLQIAQGWLGLISKPKQSKADEFQDQVDAKGTGQNDSMSSH